MTEALPTVIPLSKTTKFIVDNRGRTAPTTQQGIALIATNCVSNDDLYPTYKNVRHVSKETYATWFRSHPIPGDILITNKGSQNGAICLVPDPVDFVIAQDMVALRADENVIDPLFLFAALRSPDVQRQIKNLDVSGVIPHLKKSDFDKLLLPYPGRTSQRLIGKLYFSLSLKIELNRRMNETLEAMAEAIFRDWLVDFGPVRRKLTGATDPAVIMGGLTSHPARAADLAALFPDTLDDNGVPEGWKKSTLEEIATINDESWKASNHPDVVRYVDLSNTKWGVIGSTAMLAWAEAPSRARRIARSLDTIVGTVRPGNGSYAFISTDEYTVSTGFAVLRPRRPQYADALYIASTRIENIQRLANLADSHGGAYPAVNPDIVLATNFVFPGHEVLDAFSIFARPIRSRIEHAKQENRTLTETRDYLLPKLLSGEARARDAERATEEANA